MRQAKWLGALIVASGIAGMAYAGFVAASRYDADQEAKLERLAFCAEAVSGLDLAEETNDPLKIRLSRKAYSAILNRCGN